MVRKGICKFLFLLILVGSLCFLTSAITEGSPPPVQTPILTAFPGLPFGTRYLGSGAGHAPLET